MATFAAFLKASWFGMPVWAWCAIGLFLVFDAIIAWAKWTRAQGLIQALARVPLSVPFLAPVLLRFPVLGWALRYLAGPEPLRSEVPPAAPPSGAALLLVLGALGLAVAGACTTTNAYRVIDSAAALGRTGFDLVHELDEDTQRAIAAEKATIGEAAATAKVEEWRKKREKARLALKTFTAAVVASGATLNLIVAGQEKRITVSMVIAEVAKLVTQIRSVLDAFGVKVPLLSAREAIGIAVVTATPMVPFVGDLAAPTPIGWSKGLRTVSCAVVHPPGERCSWETGEEPDLCDSPGLWRPDAWQRECGKRVQ